MAPFSGLPAGCTPSHGMGASPDPLILPPLQHLEFRKHMDADNIVSWEAPEVGVPAPGGSHPHGVPLTAVLRR